MDGLHAACGDVAGLAAQLGRLVTDEGLRRRLGAAGRARIATEFRWEDKLALVRQAIREVVSCSVSSSDYGRSRCRATSGSSGG
jgi:glycosyltransferase involved in cell wall biosynthesis